MQLTYQPDGQDPRTFTLRPRKLRSAEAEALERATGMTLDEFYVALLKGSMLAQRGALWTLLRREQPDLKFAAVDLCADEVTVKLEAEEAAQFREAVQDAPSMDEQLREQLATLIDQATAAAPEDAPALKVAPVDEEPGPFGQAATG